MAMLVIDDHPDEAQAAANVASSPPRGPDVSDEDIERWLEALPWPRRWFARFYRALRKLQPAFPPMSCC